MAKSKAIKGVGVIVALMVTTLVIAFMVPVFINGVYADTSTTINQSVGSADTIELGPEFNGTLSAKDGTTGDVDVTITYQGTDSQISALTEGNNETVTAGDNNVTVYYLEDTGSSSAQLTYEYPKTMSMSGNAAQLFILLPLLGSLVILLLLIGWAINNFK